MYITYEECGFCDGSVVDSGGFRLCNTCVENHHTIDVEVVVHSLLCEQQLKAGDVAWVRKILAHLQKTGKPLTVLD